MKRVRVVYFVPYLSVGGVERQLQLLATGLNASRYEPIVCCPGRWGPVGTELREAGIPVVRLPFSANVAGSRVRTRAWLKLSAADIFHSFEYYYTNYIGGWEDISLARSAGIPICLTMRADLRYWANGAPATEAENARNRLTDRIICNSAAVAEACIEFERVSTTQIHVIHGGVPIPKECDRLTLRGTLGLPQDALLVGSVANLRPIKDYPTLVSAFQKVVEHIPSARLLVCGYGPSHADVVSCIEAAGLRDSVVMLGMREDMASVYRDLDLTVQSSRSEGMPTAILEAMAHGLPVVATNVGGTREAVQDGVCGTLVPPGDPDRLAQAMLQYLCDPILRVRAGAEGRRRVQERFSVDRMIRSHEELYEKCLLDARIGSRAPHRAVAPAERRLQIAGS